MTRRSYALFALCVALGLSFSDCFTPQPRFGRFETVVAAKTNKKRSRTTKSANSGSGAGFGATPTSSSSSSSSTQSKVRSVSGFTGSGTKPLQTAANTFDSLRKSYGVDCTHDVYVRSPANNETLYWFVGKIARGIDEADLSGDSIPTPQEAVLSQKRLILEYAKHELRPQNFGGPYAASLEVWLAPGDSEMDVVQNKVILEKVEGSTSNSLSESFHVADVGFNPEIYVGEEVQKGGLRIVRDDEGRPIRPVFEVNQSA